MRTIELRTRKAAVLFGNWELRGRHENMRRIELRTRKAAVLFGNWELCGRHGKNAKYGGMDPRFLDLCTSWRWMVNFTLLSPHPQRKNPLYPLDRRLVGFQSLPGRYGYASVCVRDSEVDINHESHFKLYLAFSAAQKAAYSTERSLF
jgi:hypothetical protein